MASSSSITTKELARHLGLLKRRSSSISSNKEGQPSKKKSQIFSYVIVLDFEATCWKEKLNGHHNEIIEFPAVLLDLSSGEIVDRFQHYVKPSEHKKLSTFCTELTAITQEQVDGGISIRQCLKLFEDWVRKWKEEKQFTFDQNLNGRKRCALVTWTDWDLNVCLKYECKRKGIHYPKYMKSWIDLKKTYKEFYMRPPKGLRHAMEEVNLTFRGREHSGIDDATNTAYLTWQMIKDGCQLVLTKSILLNVNNVDEVNKQGKIELTKENKSTDTGSVQQKENKENDKIRTPISVAHQNPMLKSVKITPPLCKCGRRCKRKKVMNPGPNIDRVFYSCPESRDSGCKYFKWEEKLLSRTTMSKQTFTPRDQNTKIQFETLKKRSELKDACTNLFNT